MVFIMRMLAAYTFVHVAMTPQGVYHGYYLVVGAVMLAAANVLDGIQRQTAMIVDVGRDLRTWRNRDEDAKNRQGLPGWRP